MAGKIHKLGDVESPDSMVFRIVHISDTHMRHNDFIPRIPAGDILIHSGDFSSFSVSRYFGHKARDRNRVIAEVDSFFEKLPFRHKIFVAGNHEVSFTRQSKEFVETHLRHVTYLQDSACDIEGIKIYGTPWNTKRWKSYARGFAAPNKDLSPAWKSIPSETDILVTHMPPRGIMDLATKQCQCCNIFSLDLVCEICGTEHPQSEHWGNGELLETIFSRVR